MPPTGPRLRAERLATRVEKACPRT
jgi:hypothetical protein